MALRTRTPERRQSPRPDAEQLTAAELALIVSCGESVRKGDWNAIRSAGLAEPALASAAKHGHRHRWLRPLPMLFGSLLGGAVAWLAARSRGRVPHDRS
jgi:hypothetical protein